MKFKLAIVKFTKTEERTNQPENIFFTLPAHFHTFAVSLYKTRNVSVHIFRVRIGELVFFAFGHIMMAP